MRPAKGIKRRLQVPGTKPKVIHIGFNKCGTRTFHHFFGRNGLPSVHWDKGRLGAAIQANMTTGRPAFSGYDEYVAFSDLTGPKRMPVFDGNTYFEYIDKSYPDALFILITRPIEAWIKSRTEHKKFIQRYSRELGLNSADDVKDYWRSQWIVHNKLVEGYFASRAGRLLLFNLESDDPSKIADFVAPYYRVDPSLWGHVGATKPSQGT